MFVRDAEKKPERQDLIRSIVAMAAALNVKVVIEGVETIEQLKLVNDLGCHVVQGYIFSKPMDEQITPGYLDNHGQIEVLQELDCLNTIGCIPYMELSWSQHRHLPFFSVHSARTGDAAALFSCSIWVAT